MGRQSLRVKATRKGSSAMIAARAGAIENMPTQLFRKFNMIERSVNDLRADNIRYYYKIGKICEEIRENPERYVGKDGTSGLKLIEQALSTQARTLRKASAFAREYTEEQVKSLIEMQNQSSQFQLHWGHVSFLLTLPADRRERFAREAVDKMLDPAALHSLIKKRTQRSGGHGRRHEMPKTINAQIGQIHRVSKQWLDKNENVWNGADESVFGNVLNMAVDDMEPDMVTVLEEIEGQMHDIAAAASENATKAARAKEYLQEHIARRDANLELASQPNRKGRNIDLT